METKINTFWLDFKNHFLEQKANNPVYLSWLKPIIPSKIEKKGKQLYLTLQAPSNIHKKWLQDHFLKDFYKHINKFYHGSLFINLTVVPRLPIQNSSKLKIKSPSKSKTTFFNTYYTFKNFITGENNHLAYSASLSIAKNLKKESDFNPLFIYGPSGLGKTHLLNAIGQKYLEQYPNHQVVYLSAERFLNEYIKAIQNKQMEAFRKKFRKHCDLLLLDDIQIISKGKGIQEEFFHTFNELNNKNVKIVLCCDQAPNCVPHLENRIKTRLEGGLMADIHYPNMETRLAILKNKLKSKNLSLSTEAITRIIQVCKKSIREMEGVINKIKVMTDLYERDLNMKEINFILSKIKIDLSVKEIQIITAKAFQISFEDLLSPSRKKQIVRARQTAMFLIRKFLKKSLTDISLAFLKKDHTTVLSSIKKVEKLTIQEPEFQRVLDVLHREIHNNY